MRNRMKVILSVVLVLVFALSFVVSTAIAGPWTPPGCCKYSVHCWDGTTVIGWGERIDKYTCIETPYSRGACGLPPMCRNEPIP